MTELFDCRTAFATALEDLAARDPRIIAVTNDAKSSSKLSHFADQYPQQFINVGIAEQNLIGIASGLANGGKFLSSVGQPVFSPVEHWNRSKLTWLIVKPTSNYAG